MPRGESTADWLARDLAARLPGASGTPPASRLPMHCWATLDGTEHPAVLVEWQHSGTEWEGRVVLAVRDPVTVIDRWLPASALRPASASSSATRLAA